MRNETTRWWRGTPLLLALCGAFAAAGCSSTGPGGSIESEVVFYRAQWESTKPASYTYAVRHTCFCGQAAIGPVRVTVGPSGVTSRVYVDTSMPVDSAVFDVFPDIDGLFDVIQQAIEDDAHRIDVTWDETMGYPLDISIDYIELAVDDERGYQITELPE